MRPQPPTLSLRAAAAAPTVAAFVVVVVVGGGGGLSCADRVHQTESAVAAVARSFK